MLCIPAVRTTEQEMYGLAELEAAILRHKIRNISHWSVFQHQQQLLVAITLLKLALQQHPFPKFPPSPSSPSSSSTSNLKLFGELDIDRCFATVFRNFPLEMMNQEEIRWMLTTGEVSFVTAWDIGMNKAVFDVMVMVAPECDNAVLLDFFNLNRDADTIDEIPDLGASCYSGRYDHSTDRSTIYSRNDAKELLRLRTKLEYLFYPMFVLGNRPCVLVATHNHLAEQEVKEKSKRVLQEVEMQFHTREHSNLPLPHLMPVGYEDKESIIRLRRHLEELIFMSPQFNVQLPMKWGFLRTYLGHTRKMYISLPELKAIAKHLHITNSEVTEFLKLFVKCGSVIHVRGHCPECADGFVILRVAEFLREVEKLYYIQDNPNIAIDLRERAKFGYISRDLADALWVVSPSDPPDTGRFFIHALRRMGVLIALKPIPLGPGGKEPRELYFMPRIRPRVCNEAPAHSSLFLTHGPMFPFPLQSQFLTHFHEVLDHAFSFEPMDCLNTLRFKTVAEGHYLTLRFMIGYIEVHGTGFDPSQRSVIKTACVEVMAAIQRQRPKLNLKYSFAILCPKSPAGEDRKPHFPEFHALESVSRVFCYQCMGMVEVGEEGRVWIEALYTGPRSLVQCKGGKPKNCCILLRNRLC